MLKTKFMLAGTGLALIAILQTQLASAQDAVPSAAEMWAVIQQQQKLIDQLQTELAESKVEQIEVKQSVESVADAIESGAIEGAGGNSALDGLSIGGYGEVHYEGGAKDEIDFHRFVLFIGHEFTDNIRFFSELEIEHALAGDGKPGEVELEQAFVELDLGENNQVWGGLHLVPVGLLNDIHEPPTFYGVERPAVEKNIIPTTWWEAGLGARGNIGSTGLSWDAMISSGLELNAANGYNIRSGRQKVAEAPFNSQAYTGRIQYSGIPGVRVASSLYYQGDVTQSAGDGLTGKDVSALLWTSHIDAKFKGFGLRALHANWSLDGAEVDLTGRDKQSGFYIEPSYAFNTPMGMLPDARLGAFYRYADWDNNAGLNNDTGVKRNVFGINFWPIPDVVLKMDYINERPENSNTDVNSMNLGIGYQF
ncbi:MAG: porin [Acidimicrobiales bacterium]|nr:porin [Hyphomonadaceae bacterium]RZV42670.1 MAG: porin [Acidimicrobiales bacterium]